MAKKTYCARCDRAFSTSRAMQQHLNDSYDHHRCGICGFDAPTRERLLEHHRKTQHRTVCKACNDGRGAAWVTGSESYFDHLEEENVCPVCEQHFDSPSNLEHHGMVHMERSIGCYGCDREFITYPAMILHLEAGTCPSGIDTVDLNESAAMCYQWAAFVDREYRSELLDRKTLQGRYSGPVYPFKCPECDVNFSKLSGLFQHVYSKACDQRLDEGKMAKLVRWLENRHDV